MNQPRKIRSSHRRNEGMRSTLLVAAGSVLLLLLGFAAGWFARPFVGGGNGGTGSALQPTGTQPAAAATDSPDMQATRDALMQTLSARVRHWRGAENAPVTLLDFSDFQ